MVAKDQVHNDSNGLAQHCNM